MDVNDLEFYIKDHKTVTIAEVQQKFGLKYGEAREAFSALEKEGKIKYVSGVNFEWCLVEPTEELLEKHRKELHDRLAQLRDKRQKEIDLSEFEELFDDEEDEDDEDDDLIDLGGLFEEETESKPTPMKWSHGEPTLAETAAAIQNKLAIFNINVKLADILQGASVTRFVFDLTSPQTRMSELPNYAQDIKACTGSNGDVRIIAPLFGTNQVAVEIANTVRSIVTLESVINSDNFRKSKGKLPFAVGRDLHNVDVVADLAELPHLLVAGATGAGKSVVLNNLILSLAQKYSPDYVKFLLVDPKVVEFTCFNAIPHLLTSETITDTADALAALDFLIKEMNNRYLAFRESGVGNIVEYNKNASIKLPYLVFVVDELADVMYNDRKAFETRLMRLAQKCRASGIHLVLATQRPDVSVVTGTVKANIPARIALKVVSALDSAIVINSSGAEKLLGRGDMLFVNCSSPEAQRIQGAYADYEEVTDAVKKLKVKYPRVIDNEIEEKIFLSRKRRADEDGARARIELDPLCKKALRFWLEKQSGRASIASIQRNLGIGFNRAGRIMDSLQKLGYVEELKQTDPSTKPVMVRITLGDLDRLFPDQED